MCHWTSITGDRLEWVAQAAQAGFHCYHVAEHHHSPLGAAPQPRPAGARSIYNPGVADFNTVQQWERLIVGSPQTVRQYVERYVTESTCNYLEGSFQWGDLTHAEASRSPALFAAEVMPHFVDSPLPVSARF
jgi:alkanesulfonate monooxygenase SsuD/methylene tetrahydromethanopterin reductase-like flavin-dependent oxidoreductase (luciferase family)